MDGKRSVAEQKPGLTNVPPATLVRTHQGTAALDPPDTAFARQIQEDCGALRKLARCLRRK